MRDLFMASSLYHHHAGIFFDYYRIIILNTQKILYYKFTKLSYLDRYLKKHRKQLESIETTKLKIVNIKNKNICY